MTPRVILDIEPGAAIERILTGNDQLGIAYAATRGGARGIMLPISATGRPPLYSVDLFDRSGLPTLIVKCDESELERAAALGSAPERILVTGERGCTLQDITGLGQHISRSAGTHQETAALVDPEIAILKSASRLGCAWVYFPTDTLYAAKSVDEGEAERARLTSAALAANKLNLRIGLIGPTGRHLPFTLASLPFVEEITPTPDLWVQALRVGWENAVAEFLRLCR
jgi:hypothetical protein